MCVQRCLQPLKPRAKQMSLPLCRWPSSAAFKVNKVRFSNPKRLLKSLLICLPFCFICSAQVKGNLTFGILTANNAVPGTSACTHALFLSFFSFFTKCRGLKQDFARQVLYQRNTACLCLVLNHIAKSNLELIVILPPASGFEMLESQA